MFLHSGAGLHGHEYSKRDTPTTGHAAAAPRRNSLLRSSFSAPINRASTYADSRSHPPPVRTIASSSLKRVRPRPVSDYSPASPDTIVRFLEPPEHAPAPASGSEVMDGDDASSIVDISDSDTSRAPSSSRRHRRRSTRSHSSYVLAQAPPTANKKQRFLHIRPKLLLQLQQASFSQRPRPMIDVYPSSGIVNTAIAAHLCKRFPRLSRIKSEKSIQDVLLLKSEDYATSDVDSDSDGDEESIKNRDIIAILSPLSGQDKAEIALPDGTVWVAAPRMNGNNLSYEFTTVDDHGITITARWVRRHVVTKSLPNTPPPLTPLSPMSPASSAFPFPPASPPPEYKFTFSIIDPNCRRHPIMATLLPSSLDIQDTFTTVSQSSGKYPPTSPQLKTTDDAESEKETVAQRTTRSVEEWQKSFIQISALWVALRHGWVPQFKPANFIPQSASVTSLTARKTHNRSRSYSTGTDVGSTTASRTLTGRLCCNNQPTLPEERTFGPGVLPRRATSTGAARMQRLRAERLSEATEVDDTSSIRGKGRRVMSGDWNLSTPNRHSATLAGIVDSEPSQSDQEHPAHKSGVSAPVSPDTVAPSIRPVSEFYTSKPTYGQAPKKNDVPNGANGLQPKPSKKKLRHYILPEESESDSTRKPQRWKSLATWFSKLRAR